MIELTWSARAFEALGHEARLAILRRLIPAGPVGIHAGAIGEALELPANRLSFHLNRLTAAGLIESRREGRHLYYAVRYAELGALVGFLVDDCCAAAPAGCLPECPPACGSPDRTCAPAFEPCRSARKKEDKDAAS